MSMVQFDIIKYNFINANVCAIHFHTWCHKCHNRSNVSSCWFIASNTTQVQKQVLVEIKPIRKLLVTACAQHWISWCVTDLMILEKLLFQEASTTDTRKVSMSLLQLSNENLARHTSKTHDRVLCMRKCCCVFW